MLDPEIKGLAKSFQFNGKECFLAKMVFDVVCVGVLGVMDVAGKLINNNRLALR